MPENLRRGGEVFTKIGLPGEKVSRNRLLASDQVDTDQGENSSAPKEKIVSLRGTLGRKRGPGG